MIFSDSICVYHHYFTTMSTAHHQNESAHFCHDMHPVLSGDGNGYFRETDDDYCDWDYMTNGTGGCAQQAGEMFLLQHLLKTENSALPLGTTTLSIRTKVRISRLTQNTRHSLWQEGERANNPSLSMSSSRTMSQTVRRPYASHPHSGWDNVSEQ